MDKRYQVFVSSTYEDLRLERQAVIQALLELECIPAGMELFPASDDEAWNVIKQVIDECDYYVVIIGARYGSIAPDGMSYTEKEYRYALEKGKPTLAFIHEDPGKLPSERCESDPNLREKLDEFRELVQKKLCKSWVDSADLGLKVTQAIVRLKKDRPAVGWIRADQGLDEGAASEILRLRQRIEELEAERALAAEKPPAGTEYLARGDEAYCVAFTYWVRDELRRKGDGRSTHDFTWDELFFAVSPLLIEDADCKSSE
jgi:hypothetical protein